MKKKIALLLLATSSILASCVGTETPSSSSSDSSSSSSSHSSSSVAPKKSYSLKIVTNYDKVKLVDIDGEALKNEYLEDTLVSFKVFESEKYSARIYLNDFRLKEKDGVYSFLMARDSVLSIDATDKTYKVRMQEDEAASLLFTDEAGNALENQSGEGTIGSDVYFTLASKDGKTVPFYTTCYQIFLDGEKLSRNENGLYKIASLSKDETLTLEKEKHQYENGYCIHCGTDANVIGVFPKNNAKVEYNKTLKGWRIERDPETNAGEVVLEKEYLLYLLGDGAALELTFGNGKKFGYTALKGDAITTAISISTHGTDGKNVYETVFRPVQYGGTGEEGLCTFSLSRSVLEADGIDGNLYLYIDYANNPSCDESNPIPYFFVYGIEREKEPTLEKLLPSHKDGFNSVSEFIEGCGVKLTKTDDNTSGALRTCLSKTYLTYYKNLGKSKMKVAYSEPFDGSTSTLSQTLLLVGSLNGAFTTGKESYLANFVEMGSYEKGSFKNGEKDITTYTATYDLKEAYGENWDDDDILFQFGVHFEHSQMLKEKSVYVHNITFIE